MSQPENLDPETKNIIDKLANFVARNGPQFEEMTKQKQRDNPKFSFLFGGEFYTYYKFKVASEIALINQKNQQQMDPQQQQQQMMNPQMMPQQGPPPMQQGPPPQQPPPQHLPPPQQQHQQQQWQQQPPQQQQMPPQQPQMPPQQQQQQPMPPNSAQLQEQIAQAQTQVNSLQTHVNDQVKQSESNLAAQYQVLMQQQQAQIQERIVASLEEKLQGLLQECQLSTAEIDEQVQPIIDSCTKDAILTGKNWIMQRTSNEKFCDAISQYFQKRITAKEAPFQLRLHLIYLINDVLHHCVRRNVDNLRQSLEKVVVPIFCTSSLSADEDKILKLNKLLDLWGKNKYFGDETLEKMKDPNQALSNYQASLITENAEAVTAITTAIQSQYSALEKQHQDFVAHLNMQLATAQQQLQLLISQNDAPQVPSDGPPTTMAMGGMPGPPQNMGYAPQGMPPQGDQDYGPGGGPPPGMGPGPGMYGGPQPPQQFEYNHGSNVGMMPGDMQGGPPGPGGPLPMPDFSKPPPGFPPLGPPPPGMPPNMMQGPPTDLDLTPSVPYYELPAGLIAPLVRLEDFEYKSLEPKDIRLPHPMPPSERLLAAVEAFYQPPSRERPRDGDGWEKLGLYEFYRAKQRARRMKEEGRSSRSRSRSRSPGRSPPRRRFNSEERRPSPRSRSRSASRSRSSSRSRSRSRSPPQRGRRPARSRSRSRSKSKSPLPYLRTSRSPSPVPQRQQRATPPRAGRSPTPPSFAGASFSQSVEGRLGEENKGHMLMKKMGWGGKGLGAGEQGIVNPVEAAEVRDRIDMHKGIGIDLKDPFEQFRKNKSQGFIQRMKTRDDEKPKKKSRFTD